MLLAHRSRVALALAAGALIVAAAAPASFSPGYTYRLKLTTKVTQPSGRSTEAVVMSGQATVNANGGRLDVDDASRERGAMVDKGGYLVCDATSMMIVSPREKQVIRFAFEDLGKGMSQLANVPGMRIQVSDVKVGLEKLGAGEPMLGMTTTRFRLTQDYKVAVTVAHMSRSTEEHVEQEYWMADPKAGLANPFSRVSAMRLGGGFDEVTTRTAEATRKMGKGMALKTVSTTASTNEKGETTRSTGTMVITELKAGDVNDASFRIPSDYAVMDMGAQLKAMNQGGLVRRP